MGRVLGIGDGFFVVVLTWAVSLFLCIILSRAQSGIARLGPVLIIFAAILTVILIFVPREPQFPTVEESIVVYDYSIIYRSALIAVMALFILIGLILLIKMHFAVPIRATGRKMRQ